MHGDKTTAAPGPSGLRPDHLKDLVGDGASVDSHHLLSALDQFVRTVLTAPLPPALTYILCAARLTPLRKPDPNGGPDGTRPIAAGETLRRLTARFLMRQPAVVTDLKALQPFQCGVGMPNACPLLAMSLQQLVGDLHGSGQEDWAVLQLDFRNAFNTVRRTAVLDGVMRRCPPAACWLASCYSTPSPLYCGQQVIPSASGVQQGDPCGPAAFAWGIQDLVEDLEGEVLWQAWYLDDAHLVGTPLQLHRAVSLVEARGRMLGLELNLSKCVLWGPALGRPGPHRTCHQMYPLQARCGRRRSPRSG